MKNVNRKPQCDKLNVHKSQLNMTSVLKLRWNWSVWQNKFAQRLKETKLLRHSAMCQKQ